MVTSGHSNLTTGCIAAAHGLFSGIRQMAPVCTTCFFGPPESKSQTASRSVQPFLHGSLLWQTDRQTDGRQTRSVTIGRIYVYMVQRCGLKVASLQISIGLNGKYHFGGTPRRTLKMSLLRRSRV